MVVKGVEGHREEVGWRAYVHRRIVVEHAHFSALASRRSLVRVRLREAVDQRGRCPCWFIEPPVDRGSAARACGGDGRRLGRADVCYGRLLQPGREKKSDHHQAAYGAVMDARSSDKFLSPTCMLKI